MTNDERFTQIMNLAKDGISSTPAPVQTGLPSGQTTALTSIETYDLVKAQAEADKAEAVFHAAQRALMKLKEDVVKARLPQNIPLPDFNVSFNDDFTVVSRSEWTVPGVCHGSCVPWGFNMELSGCGDACEPGGGHGGRNLDPEAIAVGPCLMTTDAYIGGCDLPYFTKANQPQYGDLCDCHPNLKLLPQFNSYSGHPESTNSCAPMDNPDAKTDFCFQQKPIVNSNAKNKEK